ncbi:MAG TPA: winged-helix domain-containing protein, partial [Deltaproteobacteria bacterium]|nr:winged-helix domain-containing protein [Deltaproteobacteria bacterium]
MPNKKMRLRHAILSVLQDAGTPLSSARISEELNDRGIDISERTVRLYLQAMQDEGLTERSSRRRHRITKQGVH